MDNLLKNQDNEQIVDLVDNAIYNYKALSAQLSKLKAEQKQYRDILENALKNHDAGKDNGIFTDSGYVFYSLYEKEDTSAEIKAIKELYPDIFKQVAATKSELRFNCK